MVERRWSWYWVGPVLLGLGLYALTIRGVFIYDDVWSCWVDERLAHPLDWGKFWYQGYMPGGADNLWRPLVSLSYAVQAWWTGERFWAFHLVNILLHGLACGLVAELGRRLCDRRVGLIAGLLFAAHPVHVEAVAGIVGRAEEMALIGVLAGLLTFIGRTLTTRRAVAIVGWFLFAAFSKEQGLLLPLFLLVWYWLERWGPVTTVLPEGVDAAGVRSGEILGYAPRMKGEMTAPQKAARLLVALLTGTMAVYVAYRNHILPWFWERSFLDQAMNPLVKSVGADRWLIPFAVLGRYAMLLFVPYRLRIDYGMDVFTPRLNWGEPWFYIGCVALVVGLGALVMGWRRRDRNAFFLLLALGASYGMVSNFFIIGTIMGERLMYLPSAFFCLLVGMAMARMRRGRVVMVGVLLVLASVRTVSYAWEWNSTKRLYSYEVATEPRASMPYLLLAGELNYRDADALLAKARQVAPDAPQVWGKSAWCKIGLGQLDEAEKFAQQSMRLRPGNGDAMGAMQKIGELRASEKKVPVASDRAK